MFQIFFFMNFMLIASFSRQYCVFWPRDYWILAFILNLSPCYLDCATFMQRSWHLFIFWVHLTSFIHGWKIYSDWKSFADFSHGLSSLLYFSGCYWRSKSNFSNVFCSYFHPCHKFDSLFILSRHPFFSYKACHKHYYWFFFESVGGFPMIASA
jgi:hypothetical protein